MITVGPVALYLLIMMTHSDAGCLKILTMNQKTKVEMGCTQVPPTLLFVYSLNVGDCKIDMDIRVFFFFSFLCVVC